MMNSEKSRNYNEPPQPGKTIVYLEGEILTVTLNQWGFTGKLRTKFGEYNYKLNDTASASSDILIGLKLIITNGFCYENKKKETVVSDGKFGKISTEIERNYIKQLNSEKKIIVSILETCEKKDNIISLFLKNPLTPFDKYEINLNLQKSIPNSLDNFNHLTDKLIILEGKGDFSDFIVYKLELINENHFIAKLLELSQNQTHTALDFSNTILNQLNYIESFHASFNDILFNMKGKVSKNLLDNLKELLFSKLLDGEVKYPYNILISKKDIEVYLESMIKFTKDAIYKDPNISSPEQLLIYIKYYYPYFKMKNF